MLRSIEEGFLKVVGYCRKEVNLGVAETQGVGLPDEHLGENGNLCIVTYGPFLQQYRNVRKHSRGNEYRQH
jgi:hypothetical protein